MPTTTPDYEELLELASSEPTEAIGQVDAIIEEASSDSDVARARRVRSLALANLGDLHAAQQESALALDAARGSEDRQLLGEVQTTRAGVLAWAGDQEGSLSAIDEAYECLTGIEQARAQAQRGGIHYRLGNFTLAREDLDDAIAILQSQDDLMWAGHALTNRGLLNAYEGAVPAANADLHDAKASYQDLAHATSVAFADQNLGWLALRSGDFPAALNFLDEAEQAMSELGTSLGQLWCDRAEALLAAHMAADAQQVAVRAAHELRNNGLQAAYADALLQAAQASILAGDLQTASDAARTARELMKRQGRDGWAAFADYLAMRARAADGDLDADDLATIRAAVAALDAAGLQTEAVHARLLAAAVATEAGDFEACRVYLTEASAARSRGPVELRAQGWVAAARLRLHAGNKRAAAAAARAGLDVLDRYQATLGGTMARLHVTGYGSELAEIGMQLAVESGSPRRIFDWMELTRAGALRSHPSGRHREPMLTSLLLQFREADEELRRATLNGESSHSLRSRRDRLQERIRDVALRARAVGTGRIKVQKASDVLENLGDATLVQYAEDAEGTLRAIRLGPGGARQFELGPIGVIRKELDSLSIALRRLAVGAASEASVTGALAIVKEASHRLDQLLVHPLQIESRRIIIVPMGALYSVPWSLMPSTAHSDVIVSPSASLWLAKQKPAPSMGRSDVSVVAGPRLEHSADEVRRVGAVYDHSLQLVSPSAGQAARALDGAAIAHVACHGDFRADNPLFSSLEMGDGPLTVYDLEALEQAPEVMVLSACDAGANTTSGGHEVMGLATALLAQGTRSVIANVGLVPDQLATIDLMVDVHQRLREGVEVSAALAAALPPLDYSDPDSIAARAFVTFGA
ncbi:MAG: CHAT domain-containing protein [Acidimicrobiia bacterium]|nr:CHAT domain-containing protein [Acidimicrobiia bacterium]